LEEKKFATYKKTNHLIENEKKKKASGGLATSFQTVKGGGSKAKRAKSCGVGGGKEHEQAK